MQATVSSDHCVPGQNSTVLSANIRRRLEHGRVVHAAEVREHEPDASTKPKSPPGSTRKA